MFVGRSVCMRLVIGLWLICWLITFIAVTLAILTN